jgi:hypothetical protein
MKATAANTLKFKKNIIFIFEIGDVSYERIKL